MYAALRVEEIDALLNELEQAALAAETPKLRFLASVLERVSFVLAAQGAALVVQASPGHWATIALSGDAPPPPTTMLGEVGDNNSSVLSTDRLTLAVPIRKSQWARGCLIVTLRQPPSAGQFPELVSLCQAFAEILALRQWAELEQFLDTSWPKFQNTLSSIAASTSMRQAAYCGVNDLAHLLEADRVSIIPARGRVLAVSGTVQPDHRSDAVVAIAHLGKQAIAEGGPVARRGKPDSQSAAQTDSDAIPPQDACLANYVCVPFSSRADAEAPAHDTAVLFEWDDYEQFASGCSVLNYVFPAFVTSWQRLAQLLGIPWVVRWSFAPKATTRSSRMLWRATKLAAVLAVLGAGIYLLNIPTPVRIEASGALQPTQQRIVFASLDGIVVRLLTGDGQHVLQGEALAEMQSPRLELELQEVRGEILANSEKRDGLSIAINQLTSNTPDAFTVQNKLSSEIRQLEAQLANLSIKQAALMEQREQLIVRSPINGVVVSNEIERHLGSRPVLRGDPLLRVVDLAGPWQLELLVADRDSGYVKQKLFSAGMPSAGAVPAAAQREIEYVMASQPEKQLAAQLSWISESARNPNGQGMFIDMVAEVDGREIENAHMGASVTAFIDCNKRPRWFVWSRPLIEAIQRKLWF